MRCLHHLLQVGLGGASALIPGWALRSEQMWESKEPSLKMSSFNPRLAGFLLATRGRMGSHLESSFPGWAQEGKR